MRDPAIHIKRSDLLRILEDYGVNYRDMSGIMLAASKINIKNRVNVILCKKSQIKAKKSIETNTSRVEQFNRIYATVLMENKIKYVPIHRDDLKWKTLIQVTHDAEEFCTLFDLDYNTGFLIYMRTAVKVFKNGYTINKLRNNSDLIVSRYRARDLVNNDDAPALTDAMYRSWQYCLLKYFKTKIDIKKDPEKYSHFILARQSADSVGANYDDWMAAQFEKWLYTRDIPAFTQYYGDNAKLNYQIYMSRKETDNDFDEIKKAKEIVLKTPVIQRGQNKI